MEASRVFTSDLSRKKHLNVLSIDWDVFHDMRQFMPGSMECQIDWIVEYSRWSGDFVHSYKFFKEEYLQLMKYISRVRVPVYFADDHKDITNVIPQGSSVSLTNLDYHCDTGLYEDFLHCGNWMSYLKRKCDCEVELKWHDLFCKNLEGWDKSGLDSSFPFKPIQNFDGVFDKDYHLIFICQSYLYSPPHMGHYLKDLVKACKNPVISKTSPMFFPTYSERWVKFYDEYLKGVNNYSPYTMYFPTGKETDRQMDEIYDDHDNLIIHGVDILESFPDCDEHYRQ